MNNLLLKQICEKNMYSTWFGISLFRVLPSFLSLFSLRFIKNIPSQSDCVRPAPRDIPPKTRSTPEPTLVVDLVSVRSGASRHLTLAVTSHVDEFSATEFSASGGRAGPSTVKHRVFLPVLVFLCNVCSCVTSIVVVLFKTLIEQSCVVWFFFSHIQSCNKLCCSWAHFFFFPCPFRRRPWCTALWVWSVKQSTPSTLCSRTTSIR